MVELFEFLSSRTRFTQYLIAFCSRRKQLVTSYPVMAIDCFGMDVQVKVGDSMSSGFRDI